MTTQVPQYNLYHYRGKLIGTYPTSMEADEAKHSQRNPSEFYWEREPGPGQGAKVLADLDRKV